MIVSKSKRPHWPSADGEDDELLQRKQHTQEPRKRHHANDEALAHAQMLLRCHFGFLFRAPARSGRNIIFLDHFIHFKYHFAMIITIDKAGRVVLPKRVRETFNLYPGAVLELESDADEIRMRVAGREPSLIEKDGFVVHHGSEMINVNVAEFINRERDLRALRCEATAESR